MARTYTLTEAARKMQKAGIMLVRPAGGGGVVLVELHEVKYLIDAPKAVVPGEYGVTLEELAAFRAAYGGVRSQCSGIKTSGKRCGTIAYFGQIMEPREWVAAAQNPPVVYCQRHEGQNPSLLKG